ncbi:hypothetical protein N337_09118 [Phoenicopterus ruber ruber]|uniref:RBM11 regulator n=1 Tax=Phoenicopterus ruber ruber TaxID=9218 RepID=A0A091U9C9_PHORB|nr:hypothetical protein N337_09118 [Phoenicopterus ruber ruber]
MNHFLAQQYTVQSPTGQQFPYYQMTQPLPSNLSLSPYQNQAANFKSAQSSLDLALPHSSDCEVHRDESTSKRKRERQSCDSDTSIEDDQMRQRERDQKYKKRKAKKKTH